MQPGDEVFVLLFLRRFSKRIKKSGVLVRAKKNRYRAAKVSKNRQHEQRLERLKRHAEIEHLKKIGKYEEMRLARMPVRRKGGVSSALPSSKEQVTYDAPTKSPEA